jgi:hypothetical protein
MRPERHCQVPSVPRLQGPTTRGRVRAVPISVGEEVDVCVGRGRREFAAQSRPFGLRASLGLPGKPQAEARSARPPRRTVGALAAPDRARPAVAGSPQRPDRVRPVPPSTVADLIGRQEGPGGPARGRTTPRPASDNRATPRPARDPRAALAPTSTVAGPGVAPPPAGSSARRCHSLAAAARVHEWQRRARPARAIGDEDSRGPGTTTRSGWPSRPAEGALERLRIRPPCLGHGSGVGIGEDVLLVSGQTVQQTLGHQARRGSWGASIPTSMSVSIPAGTRRGQ